MQLKYWMIISFIFLLTACGSGEEPQAGKELKIAKAPTGFVPSEPQQPGDPKAGYDAIINKAYVTCGIPYSAYKKSGLYHPPKYSLPGRTKINAQLPYNQTYYQKKDGTELVVNNCLTCHGGLFNDKLIVGLGNESLDLTQDFVANAESVGVYVEGKKETAEWRRWADRITGIAPYIRTDTVGVNSAVNMTWALFAHRDPKTLAWSDKPLIAPPPKKPLPVSVPPWWRMQKKHAMFYSAAGRGDHARLEILASTFCTDTVEEAQAIDSYAPDIRAYIASLEPPTYPFSINQELATQGKVVFEEHCSRCHGTYGKNEHYPNLVIPLEEVGTDPEYVTAAMGGQLNRFGRWLEQSFYGKHSRLAMVPGYIAPPLDGIWATAPYLHNGSIPTVEALLNSAERPRYWTRTFDSKDYNDKTLGWNYTKLAYGKADATDPEQRRRLYDTTLRGYSNEGHTFGDNLTEEERQRVLEYLKTL
jgi:mono/diheme cytochrome c family protein